ncbi:ImmA/IrrE family metallo-endopeptidase [Nitrospirillum sp. BR 11164]|uniref:ImmA/IrrE family metallo-endopeptidase n=1 Tax=Nitrospirillum sp. BR 11164 TaxID=3104324 RepID=UPI002B003938|nr:ImmA/IrrE family metallo-endopeptidase [Nitrospirillum sp. BR 11164]MEA1653020.1 ImmA/IrrE family metallo-endopeptidase [Nitrospirillum sp. BR 11164]
MSLRRGFKAEANDYAVEFRKELRLDAHEPLCPRKLAKHLEIPVSRLSEFASDIPEHYSYFTGVEGRSFSAVTVFFGRMRLIIHNDSHALPRQAANIAHELAHGILHHPPSPPLNEHGCRHFDQGIEEEANWLGPALLVSEEAAIHVARTGLSAEEAAKVYGVSEELMRMRLNVTGAYKRVLRIQNYYARRK